MSQRSRPRGEEIMSRQSLFMSLQNFGQAEWFLVMTEHFYVVTNIGQDKRVLCHDRVLPRLRDFVSRQSWPRQGDFLSRLSILCRNKVGQGKKKLCRNRIVLCRDRVG